MIILLTSSSNLVSMTWSIICWCYRMLMAYLLQSGILWSQFYESFSAIYPWAHKISAVLGSLRGLSNFQPFLMELVRPLQRLVFRAVQSIEDCWLYDLAWFFWSVLNQFTCDFNLPCGMVIVRLYVF